MVDPGVVVPEVFTNAGGRTRPGEARIATLNRKAKATTGPERPPEELLEEVRRIVLSELSRVSAVVYLFGSAARGGFTHASDIDVAVDPREPLPPGMPARLREALEESREGLVSPLDAWLTAMIGRHDPGD